MIAEIAEAIMHHYNKSTSLKDALSGGLYFQQAPQNTTSPYGVFYIIGITHDEIMGTADDNITHISLQFNLFEDMQDGGSAIANITALLAKAYDWAEIYVDGYYWIKMQRENILPISYIDEVWQVTVNYELSIQKS